MTTTAQRLAPLAAVALTGILAWLSGVAAHAQVNNRRDAGLQRVKLEQIRGSVGRSIDFDADFRPLRFQSL